MLTVALQLATLYVPAMQRILKTDALTAAELGLCFLASALVPCAVEIEKAWLRMSGEGPAKARAVRS